MQRRERQKQVVEKQKQKQRLRKHREKRWNMEAWMRVVYSALYGIEEFS